MQDAHVQTHHIGLDGFIWWMGVIEDVKDPLAIGRAKVRIIGWHTEDKTQLSTNDLPWAVPLMPVTDANKLPNYKPGDWVAGWFMDGMLGQQPLILGVTPAVPQGSPFGAAVKFAVKTYVNSQTGGVGGQFI